MNNVNKKKLILSKFSQITLLVIFSLLLLFSLVKICLWFVENNKTKNVVKVINKTTEVKKEEKTIIDDDGNEQEVSIYQMDFNELKKINKNVKAWLVVNGTNINYPVVQTKDNSYYLNHSFNNKYNTSGWPFIDYENNLESLDKNTIIYAHNRLNGDMFGTLSFTQKKSYFNDPSKHYINLTINEHHYVFKVFSVYNITAENYYRTINFNSNEEYLTFLNTLKERSIYNFGVDLKEDDKIITLSTCTIEENGRGVLHAKLIYDN